MNNGSFRTKMIRLRISAVLLCLAGRVQIRTTLTPADIHPELKAINDPSPFDMSRIDTKVARYADRLSRSIYGFMHMCKEKFTYPTLLKGDLKGAGTGRKLSICLRRFSYSGPDDSPTQSTRCLLVESNSCSCPNHMYSAEYDCQYCISIYN